MPYFYSEQQHKPETSQPRYFVYHWIIELWRERILLQNMVRGNRVASNNAGAAGWGGRQSSPCSHSVSKPFSQNGQMWKSWGYTTWVSSSVGTSDFGLQGYVGGILQQFILICVERKTSYFMTPAFCPSFAQAQQGLLDTPWSLEWPYFQDSLPWVFGAAEVQTAP